MTDINEVMGRLGARADAWSLNTDSARVSVRLGDLKALLSYTKQCREALELANGVFSSVEDVAFSNNCSVTSDLARDGQKIVAKALSTQPGERE